MGMAKFGAEKNLAPILKYRAKVWHKFPDCGGRTRIDREWWLLFPVGLWLVAVISWRLLDGCLAGCCYFLEASGHNGFPRSPPFSPVPPSRGIRELNATLLKQADECNTTKSEQKALQ